MKRSNSAEHGFSLIEVLIILLIVAALAAITVPNVLTAIRAYRLNIAANALAQQLNKCRQEAVRGNQPLRILVTSTSTQIDTNRDATFDGNDDAAVATAENATITVVTPSDGIVLFTSRGELPNLTPSPVFRIVVGSRQREVVVDTRGVVTVGEETGVSS